MNIHVFACDYDRTIADGGRCSPEVAAALGRVRESGRKILLVTGRMLSDLRSVCADVDRMFDAYGFYYNLSCHCMSAVGAPTHADAGRERMDFCIGNLKGTTDYRDWGDPVDVPEPPADQVVDLSELMKKMGT